MMADWKDHLVEKMKQVEAEGNALNAVAGVGGEVSAIGTIIKVLVIKGRLIGMIEVMCLIEPDEGYEEIVREKLSEIDVDVLKLRKRLQAVAESSRARQPGRIAKALGLY